MATLTVNGVKVTVDDSFRDLSPEQQEATVNEIAASLGNQSQASATNGPATPTDASSVFVDEMLFGLPGKASAALNAAIRAPFTDKSFGEEYDAIRASYNRGREQYAEKSPVANTAATMGGNLFGALYASPMSATRLVPQSAGALGRFAGMTGAAAADGATIGAVSAYGHDQDIGTGALIGGALGAASYPAIQAASVAARPVLSALGIGNQGRAQSAVADLLNRSGLSADDIADDLARASADGQGVYTVADALGNPGQRALSGIARSPGDMRGVIAETLDARQAGQGRRIANALSEGFGATDTAAQRAATLSAQQKADAVVNYGAARAGAGFVDPTRAIAAADDFLTPGASGLLNPGTNIADDSIEAAVRRARSYMTDGKSVLSDFNAAFRAKRELDAMIEGAKPAVQSQLIPIRNALDDALVSASPTYAAARDTFRQQSQAINAIDTGRNAAMRGRVEDTIPVFNAMSPEQQAAFRAGYADPLITQAQGAAIGVNKARPLINDATAAEFPAFAAPGKADQLASRIARENRMFETRGAALGGSRTADNLADMGEMAGIDPTMIGNLMSGRWGAFLGDVVRQGSQVLQGRNEAVRDRIAQALLQSDPQLARQILTRNVQGNAQSQKIREDIIRALLGTSIPAANAALN